MRKHTTILFAFLAVLLFPGALMAQSIPPPPCCSKVVGPSTTLPDAGVHTSATGNQFYLSEETMQLMGITRTQFVDRLAASLFPGKRVDLVISATRLVNKQTPDAKLVGYMNGRAGFGEEGLLAIQETRFYQIPRSRIRSEEIDALEQLYITDGEVYVKVIFSKRDLIDTER